MSFLRCVFILISIPVVSCVPIYRDVSRQSEYKKYVGMELPLKLESDLTLHKTPNTLTNTHYSSYTLTWWSGSNGMNPSDYFTSRERLKVGTRVRIVAFKRGNDQDHVLMDVFSHREGRRVRFQDTFGLSRVGNYRVEKELDYLRFR